MSREWNKNHSRKFLALLIERDGKSCHYCGQEVFRASEIDPKPLSTRARQLAHAREPLRATVDHRIPVSKGGKEFDLENMVVACISCNQDKGNRFPKKFKENKK